MADEKVTIIIDNGSGLIKAGYSGDETPYAVFPSIFGKPKNEKVNLNKDYYIGHEACAKAGLLKLKYPIEHGIITDWEMMEKIWHHTFYEGLRVDPSEHPVFLTETSMNPKPNREKMIQLMFETFNVPSFYVCLDAVLPLYQHGLTTGLSFDSGYDLTQIVPIVDNYIISDSIIRLDIGGRDLTTMLQKLLNERGNTFTTSGEKEIVRDIKETLCYVASNYDEEINKSKLPYECIAKYKHPDGSDILISVELFKCTEILFNPQLYDLNIDGIHKNIYDSIKKCDITNQHELFSNIVLSGGSSMFNGLAERINKEVKNLVHDSMKVNVIASDERKYAAWIGGSIFSILDNFENLLISHEKYNDAGPGIVHRK